MFSPQPGGLKAKASTKNTLTEKGTTPRTGKKTSNQSSKAEKMLSGVRKGQLKEKSAKPKVLKQQNFMASFFGRKVPAKKAATPVTTEPSQTVVPVKDHSLSLPPTDQSRAPTPSVENSAKPVLTSPAKKTTAHSPAEASNLAASPSSSSSEETLGNTSSLAQEQDSHSVEAVDSGSSDDDDDDFESSSDESGLDDEEDENEVDELEKTRSRFAEEEMKSKAAKERQKKLASAARDLILQEAQRKEAEDFALLEDMVEEMATIVTLDSMRDAVNTKPVEYAVGDVVLCYDMTGVPKTSILAPSGLLYRAKIKKLGMRKFRKNFPSEKAFLVGYDGYSKKWDTFVPASRLVAMDGPGEALMNAYDLIFEEESAKTREIQEKEEEAREKELAEAKAREPPSAAVLHEAAKRQLETQIFPIHTKKSLVQKLGSLSPLYFSSKQLYPVGFKSTIEFCSFTSPPDTVIYTQWTEPGIGGSRMPIFTVSAQDNDEVFRGQSPDAVWKMVTAKVKAKASSLGLPVGKLSVGGKIAFGFNDPVVTSLLEGLPGALNAKGYVFQKRRVYEEGQTAGDNATSRAEKETAPPVLTPDQFLVIEQYLADNKRKSRALEEVAKTLQRSARQWGKRRVLRKLGAKGPLMGQDNTLEALLRTDRFQSALAKYMQGCRCTLTAAAKNILGILKEKKTKENRSVVASSITNVARRVLIGEVPEGFDKDWTNDDTSRKAYWVWVLRKQDFLFKDTNVTKVDKQAFRDLKPKCSSCANLTNALRKEMAVLTDPFVTMEKAEKARAAVFAAEKVKEKEDAKFQERIDKAISDENMLQADLEAKAAKREEKERLWREKKKATEAEKMARREAIALQRAERKAEKERVKMMTALERAERAERLRLEKAAKADQDLKLNVSSKSLLNLGFNKSENPTGEAMNGTIEAILDNDSVDAVVDSLLNDVIGQTLVSEIDTLLDGSVDCPTKRVCLDSFVSGCTQTKASNTAGWNRKCKLFQFSENQRPAYWGQWIKSSLVISKRTPVAQDSGILYEIDSDEEWEDGQPAEDLDMSDGEDDGQGDEVNENEMDFGDGWLLGDDEVVYADGVAGREEDAGSDNEDGDPNDEEPKSKKRKVAHFNNAFSESRQKKVVIIGPSFDKLHLGELSSYGVLLLSGSTLNPLENDLNKSHGQANGKDIGNNSLGFKRVKKKRKVSATDEQRALAAKKRAEEKSLEAAQKAEEKSRLAAKKAEEKSRLAAKKAEEKSRLAAERALRIQREKEKRAAQAAEKQRLTEEIQHRKLMELKEKEIKHIHLTPFVECFHGNGTKKDIALAPFFQMFPKVSKSNVDKLIKLICVKESRNFDRAKWYVRESWLQKIQASPIEAMQSLKEAKEASK